MNQKSENWLSLTDLNPLVAVEITTPDVPDADYLFILPGIQTLFVRSSPSGRYAVGGIATYWSTLDDFRRHKEHPMSVLMAIEAFAVLYDGKPMTPEGAWAIGACMPTFVPGQPMFSHALTYITDAQRLLWQEMAKVMAMSEGSGRPWNVSPTIQEGPHMQQGTLLGLLVSKR